MPIKDTAFEKPGVNAAHKAAVREQARLRAAAHETADDDLLNDLQAYIAASALSASRKAEAVRGLEKAVESLRAGVDPLAALKMPGSCTVCEGNSHGTHTVSYTHLTLPTKA